MSCVYLSQEPLHMRGGVPVPKIGYHTLRPYGEHKFVFGWGELRDEDDPATLLPLAYERLNDFGDDDFILPIGSPALIAITLMVAADVNDGYVQVLEWMRERGEYRIVKLNLNEVRA